MQPRQAFRMGAIQVAPGARQRVNLPMAGLYTHTPVALAVDVVHGRKPGPVVFVSAAIHGDEINGIEIIRRLLRSPGMDRLRGTLLAVPVVNVFGFHNRSRYLPDRRDLNRSFPGSQTGSMAGRVANVFMQEIVARSDFGIDLHTAAIDRDNLPQVRADLDQQHLTQLAEAFGAPVVIHSIGMEGSMRQAAARAGVPVLLYEAGEALRFDEISIRVGLGGIYSVLRALQMLPASRRKRASQPVRLSSSTWVRAPQSGILRSLVPLGASVARGDQLALVSDPFGQHEESIVSPANGVVIGRTTSPLIYEGEALFHIGRSDQAGAVEEALETLQAASSMPASEAEDEPPIV